MKRGKYNLISVSDLCDVAVSEWDEANRQQRASGRRGLYCPGIALPWRKLSWCLNGFTQDVTVLAARPGVGKTSLAMFLTRFWLEVGLKVVFVSVDMSPLGFVKRQLSCGSGIPTQRLQFGFCEDYETDRDSLTSQAEILKGFERSGQFILSNEYSAEGIREMCADLKSEGGVDVLVVDYLQLLHCEGGQTSSAVYRATRVSNILHETSNTLQIPVLCLSQLSRENVRDGGREPQLSDLRDSGAIEQDAANVLLLHPCDEVRRMWDSNPPKKLLGGRKPSNGDLLSVKPVYCTVAKAREGCPGARLPFVAFQNRYDWYLGDYRSTDPCRQFASVHADWRHSGEEEYWRDNGALIED